MWQVGEMCRFLTKIAAVWWILYLPFDGRFVNRPYTAPNNVTDTVVGEGLKSPPQKPHNHHTDKKTPSYEGVLLIPFLFPAF